jgi:ribonuclease HI
MYAEYILQCVEKILLHMLAAIQALSSGSVKSKLVWNCLKKLQALGVNNKVTLRWVPGHKRIEGNELAEGLAKTPN